MIFNTISLDTVLLKLWELPKLTVMVLFELNAPHCWPVPILKVNWPPLDGRFSARVTSYSQSPDNATGILTSFSPLVLVVMVIYSPLEVQDTLEPTSRLPTLEPSFQYLQSWTSYVLDTKMQDY